jgi:hypothetical protein
MRKLVALMSLLSIFGIAEASDYSEGQVWSYKTRLGEEQSTVLINKIETHERLGKIFHISVDGVKVRNRHSKNGVTTEFPHFPVSEETLRKSVIKLLGKKAPNPEYIEGYKTWKAAFDAGEAGIFTISVSEIVGFVEELINKQ